MTSDLWGNANSLIWDGSAEDVRSSPVRCLARIVSGEGMPEGAGGGHAWILSNLKTLLETGKSFAN